jgi:hypothetical protein
MLFGGGCTVGGFEDVPPAKICKLGPLFRRQIRPIRNRFGIDFTSISHTLRGW